MSNLEAIAAVEGIDGIFFGPADLAASMGLLGKSADPAVRTAIIQGIETVRRVGKAAGTLASNRALAHQYLSHGALFMAVGVDTSILVKSAKELAAEFIDAVNIARSDGVY
jgi:4-hydroxy-2-oxoheptanedioate aldolase